MTGRVILFGATGYTGQLTAEALARRGVAGTVLAGRSGDRLRTLAADLEESYDWECDIAVADVSDPASVTDLVSSGDDVIVSTVGPFTKFGKPAIEAATSTGAVYLDSTGEPPFIQRVFEYYGPRAQRTGASLLTAFGYDYIPGNLAGLLAIRDAEHGGFRPTSVEVGYFIESVGAATRTISGGTAASSLAILSEPGFSFTDGAIARERPAAHVRTFDIEGRSLDALSLGGTEHFTLPRLDSSLRHVKVFLGWAGPKTRQLSRLRTVVDPLTRVPLLPGAVVAAAGTFVRGSTGGPDAADRSAARTLAVAETFAGDRLVGRAVVSGPSPYELTADLLAWAADAARQGGLGTPRRTGALGPADGFGEDAFIDGCASLGLEQVGA